MAPKKDTSAAAPAESQSIDITEGIENFELPRSLVTKIAKSALPDNAKLQKDTVSSLVKGSTVFINYLAATAHDIANSRSHKTISAADVLKALEVLELGDIAKLLQGELETFRATAKAEKAKKAAAPSGASRKGKEKEKEVLKLTIPAKAKEAAAVAAPSVGDEVGDDVENAIPAEGGGNASEEEEVLDEPDDVDQDAEPDHGMDEEMDEDVELEHRDAVDSPMS